MFSLRCTAVASLTIAALAAPALASASTVPSGSHTTGAAKSTHGAQQIGPHHRSRLLRRQVIGGAAGSVNGVVAITINKSACTGTVVAPRVVLTAAHCLETATSPAQVKVRFDYAGRQTVGVSRYYVAPGYNAASHVNDAAVLILNGVSKEPAIQIASSEPTVGVKALITGYGEHTYNGGATLTPYYAYTIMQSYGYCKAVWAKYGAPLPTSDVCAQNYPYNNNTITRGDSGGPLLVRSTTGAWLIAGINDLILIPGNKYTGGLPQAFGRVDTIRPWVEGLIKYFG